MSISRETITGAILAGGLGRRMSDDADAATGEGVEKGLIMLGPWPMVAHVMARLAPQVGSLMINVDPAQSRHRPSWEALGAPLIPDVIGGRAGPLAGLHAALCAADTRWVLCVPCDAPRLPTDLAARLSDALEREPTLEVVHARTPTRGHPVFALVRRSLAADLAAHLEAGGRRFGAWLQTRRWSAVTFDDESSFANLNTREQLRAYLAETGLGAERP